MDLTQYAQTAVPSVHVGHPARVVGGVGYTGHLKVDILHPQILQNSLHSSLQSVEIHILAVDAHGQHLVFYRQAVVAAGQVDPGHLVKAHILVTVVVVPGQSLQHGGEHRGAHDGGVLAQWVEDLEALPPGIVFRPADFVVASGGDKGVGDDLVIAHGTAQRAQLALQQLLLREPAQGGLAPHQSGGDVVVAMEPGHLFGQIGHTDDVAPPGGDGDLVAIHLEVQLLQNGNHLGLGNVGTQQAVDLFGLQLEDTGLGHIVQNVDGAVQHLAGPQQLHQLTGPVDGGQGVQRVQALFKLGGGLGAHAQSQSALADAGAVEAGRLEDHVHSVVHNLAVLAAHDARQAHGPVLVGDDQMVGVELADVAVQGGQLFALFRPADDDFAALHIAIVKGVHGLAVLQHYIVGDVHDIVDGAHAHGPQPLPHPLGGGGDLHVAHHAGGVPGAQVGGGGLHVQQLHQAAVPAPLDHRLVELQGLAEGSGSLTGQTDDRQAVGAVGCDLKLHHMVVKTDDGLDVVAGLAFLVQYKNAVLNTMGELSLLGVEVGQGADGAALGVVGHQIPLV